MPPFKIAAREGDAFKVVAICNGRVSGETNVTVTGDGSND
jgi:hypothetical protein